MKRVLAITALILMISSVAMAASSATPEDMAEAGFEHLLKGEFVKMADAWFDDFDPKQMSEEKSELAKRQYVAQMPMAGKCSRYELLDRKEYGKSVVKLKYIAFTERTPLFFTFIYFKPDQDWLAATIRFNDKVSSLDD
ncbi:MAG: hypothetical protein JEY79_02240 [Pseudodesulfovibrio sp.]|nr:hypothetical protein [Pseudodesulfovibrio sp.]